MNDQQTQSAQRGGARSAPPHGSDIVCKLVGADASDNTITLQLPPGLRPYGMVIGEMLTINRIGPNVKAER